MLMVSDLIEIARGHATAERLVLRSPQRFAQAGARRAPVVVWNVCRHCDMRCPHCYAAASAAPSVHDLPTAAAKSMLDRLARNGVTVVIFSGGEPLLRGDLLELIAHARDVGIAPQLSSNGVHIDPDAARALKSAGVAYVGVSIDGLPEFNDAWRGMERAFARASDGLRNAHDAGMRTGMRMTVTRRNVDDVFALIDHATTLSVSRFYVSHLVDSGRAVRLVGDDLRPSETRGLLWQLFDDAARRLDDARAPRIVTGGNDSDGPLLLTWVRERYDSAAAERVRTLLERRGGNSAGEAVLAIDSRGRVHPDQFWRGQSLGDATTTDLDVILAHPLAQALRTREIRLTGRCGSCTYRGICRGSHRERALARYGDVWASDPSCVMTDAEIAVPRSSPTATGVSA